MSIFNHTKMVRGRKASILALTIFLVGSTAVMSTEYEDFEHPNGVVYKPARITNHDPITVSFITAAPKGSNYSHTLFGVGKLSCFKNLEEAQRLVDQNNLHPSEPLSTPIGMLSPGHINVNGVNVNGVNVNGVNVSGGLIGVHFKPRNSNLSNQYSGQPEASIGMDVEITRQKPLELRDVQKFELKKEGDKAVIYLNDRPSDIDLAHTLITQLLEGDTDIGSFKLAQDKSNLRFKLRDEGGAYNASPKAEVVTQELNKRLQQFKDQIVIEESIQKARSYRVIDGENINPCPSTASSSTPKVSTPKAPQEDPSVESPSHVPYYVNERFMGNNSQIKADHSTLKGNNNTYWGSNNNLKGNNNKVFGHNFILKGNNNVVVGNNCTGKGNNNTFYGENNRIKGDGNEYYSAQNQGTASSGHSSPTLSPSKAQQEPLNFGNQITNIRDAVGVTHNGITETLNVDLYDGRSANFGSNVTYIQGGSGVTSNSVAKTINVTARGGGNLSFDDSEMTVIGGNGGRHNGIAEDINITSDGPTVLTFKNINMNISGGSGGTYCGVGKKITITGSSRK